MSVTIKEVARSAGVSVATVSRVMNDSGPVRAELRLRVQDVARDLRYVPHGAAKSLITNKTSTIGVLLPDLHGEFFSELIRGIDQAARARGYHLLVSSSHSDRSEIAAALGVMRGRVDGLILMSPDDAGGAPGHAPVANFGASVPVLLLNCPAGEGSCGALDIDNYGGARAMMRHLLALGHRRIAFISGGGHNHDAHERRRGYRDALHDAGVRRLTGWEIPGDFTEAAGYDAVARLLRLRTRPTAVFAANDSMAIGAMSALQERGLRIPQDVAVGGFDDIPTARYMTPPLTSVRVPITQLGAHAMNRLLTALQTPTLAPARRQEVLPTTLVVRRSCGADSSESRTRDRTESEE